MSLRVCVCVYVSCACLRTIVYVFTCKFLHVRFYVCVSTCTFLPIPIRICVDVYVFAFAYAPTAELRGHLGQCGPVRAYGPGRARVRGRGVDTGFSTTEAYGMRNR